MKNLCIVQARMGSSRLPGKIIFNLDRNISMIQFLIKRLNKSNLIEKIIVATTNKKEDKILTKHLRGYKCTLFFGPSENVLKRYYKASKKFKAQNILRITADCPLVDPVLIDKIIKYHHQNSSDYTSNTIYSTFPNGQDIEIFKTKILNIAYKAAKSKYDKEHVTPYIKRLKGIKKLNYKNNLNLSNYRMTLDYYEDYIILKKIYENLKNKSKFNLKNIITVMNKNKKYFSQKILKTKKLNTPKGINLWKKAKKIIPGGNMLLSKRPEMFLPGKWPTYYKKAKGCEIWDVGGTKYIDMSLMGVGTNILGYSNKKIDNAVIRNLKKGNMSTLNSYEEIKLSEMLLKINPWAQMVKFARSGGEANAIAIRIARASAKSDNVAFCGYHGWHDWYLSTNLNNYKNLNTHLLKDLPFSGVPLSLKNTSFPFKYNDYDGLEKLVNEKKIGIIKMEVMRDIEPKNNFLQKIRTLANKKKIILIFDECTSGFREQFGGLHKKFKVEPDIAMYGKALGNGYAITAVVGKRKFMDAAQSTFISSTFWTERAGSVAAINSLKLMNELKSWKIITNKGLGIKHRWKEISNDYNLNMKIQGLNAIPKFYFANNNLLKKTFITQELLKKKILASNSLYLSIAHKDIFIDKYLNEFKKIVEKIALIEHHKKDIKDYLDGDIAHETFKRLN